MKCYIKSKKYNVYFNKHIIWHMNHWTSKTEARLFKTIKEAKDCIKRYKLKNIEIEKERCNK